MSNTDNFKITNDTITYAEYINKYRMIYYIKKRVMELDIPLDEIQQLLSQSEEDVFLKQWDINNFGFNKCGNAILCKMWLDKETNKFKENTVIIN